MMRYRIADAMIDLIHLFWCGFLLAPLGAFAMAACTPCGANAQAKAQ